MKRKPVAKHFNDTPLDGYEVELKAYLDKGSFVSNPDLKETKKMFKEAVELHDELRRNKSITLRVKKEDLIKIKARARINNIPYQTLIGLLIHKYAEGKEKIVL